MYDFRLAQIIYEERLREAEERRRFRQNAVEGPPFRTRLLEYVGDRLIAFGSRIKEISAAQPEVVSQH